MTIKIKEGLMNYIIGAITILICVAISLLLNDGVYTWGNFIATLIGYLIGLIIIFFLTTGVD